MEVRINPKTVSHIRIRDLIKSDYIWCEKIEAKRNFWWSEDGYEEGYWSGGHQGIFSYRFDEKEGVKDIDGVLWYLPSVSVYFGEKLIKELFFETYKEARQYCDKNFPEVNVIC